MKLARRRAPRMKPRLLVSALLAAVILTTVAAASASAKTVWLCRPGQSPDPCTPGLSTTVYSPTLKPLRVEHPKTVRRPALDCFYVYPTVSDQRTPLANLQIDPEERSIALYQAARYSQYCSIYAPMYRQFTLADLNAKRPLRSAIPLNDVRAAFRTYLTKYNHGRGFVLIGHSQGSFMLRGLITKDVDGKASVRRRLVSAIILGGDVLVKRGRGIGGDFKHIPACRSATQLGCVIAFSTFDQTPPANSVFGRTTVAGEEVLCTNPASLRAGGGLLDPIFPSQPFARGTTIATAITLLHLIQPTPRTVWSSEPNAYRARCSNVGGASVLQVSAVRGAQVATPSPDPTWGLHLLDANIALGNLVEIVRREAAAFTRSAR